MRKTLFVLIILVQILLYGCNTSQLMSPDPPIWVRTNTSDTIVGGPAETLEGAKELVLKEVAALVDTRIQSVSSSYYAITQEQMKQAFYEEFQSSIANQNTAVVSGIHFTDRWLDAETQKWWVRASISEIDLDKAINDTAKYLIEQKQKTKEIANQLVNILHPFIFDDVRTVKEGLSILSQAFRFFESSGVWSMIGYVDNNAIDLREYLINETNSLLMEIHGVLQDPYVYDLDGRPFEPKIVIETISDRIRPGILPWVFSVDDQTVAVENDIDGDCIFSNPLTGLSTGHKEGKLLLDIDRLGLSRYFEKYQIQTPYFITPFEVREQTIQIEILTNDDFETIITDEVFNICQDNIQYPISSHGSRDLPKVVFELRFEDGLPNEFNLYFTYVTPYISMVYPDGTQAFMKKMSTSEGAGLTLESSHKQAFHNAIIAMNNNSGIFRDINKNIKSYGL